MNTSDGQALVLETRDALLGAFVKLVDDIERIGDEFGSAVRTPRVIVFNSSLYPALLQKYVQERTTFSDLRTRDPRAFHALLGAYVGDVKTKDRIYGVKHIDDSIDGVVLEAWILTLEISLRRFSNRAALLSQLLARHGRVRSYKVDCYDHIEAPLNRFSDGHPNNFQRTKYVSSVWMNPDAQFGRRYDGKFIFYDLFLIGNGYAGKPPVSKSIPQHFCNYSGPFLRIIIRCRRSRFHRYVSLTEECLEMLLG